MKYWYCLCLIGFSALASAQAPVEDRAAQQKPQAQSQLKADFARREKDRAADRMRRAEIELAEAKRAQRAAEKRLQETQNQVTNTQKSLEQAKVDYQQAEARAAQADAAVGQAWKK
jgi:chromosome segregation ATPase